MTYQFLIHQFFQKKHHILEVSQLFSLNILHKNNDYIYVDKNMDEK